MPFNDTSEGQTHYAGDGCQPPHVITSDSATPQPATMEKCQQYLAICKNCGRSQSAHAFAPPQSEERETLGEDIARLVDKKISKNELVLELVALFHRNNNVMPSQSEERCEFCKAKVCNGECVFGLKVNPSHPDTLRERVEEIMEQTVGQADSWAWDDKVVNLILSLINQEKERWEDETCNWIMDNIYCQHPHACVALNKLMNHLTKRKE